MSSSLTIGRWGKRLILDPAISLLRWCRVIRAASLNNRLISVCSFWTFLCLIGGTLLVIFSIQSLILILKIKTNCCYKLIWIDLSGRWDVHECICIWWKDLALFSSKAVHTNDETSWMLSLCCIHSLLTKNPSLKAAHDEAQKVLDAATQQQKSRCESNCVPVFLNLLLCLCFTIFSIFKTSFA